MPKGLPSRNIWHFNCAQWPWKFNTLLCPSASYGWDSIDTLDATWMDGSTGHNQSPPTRIEWTVAHLTISAWMSHFLGWFSQRIERGIVNLVQFHSRWGVVGTAFMFHAKFQCNYSEMETHFQKYSQIFNGVQFWLVAHNELCRQASNFAMSGFR